MGVSRSILPSSGKMILEDGNIVDIDLEWYEVKAVIS